MRSIKLVAFAALAAAALIAPAQAATYLWSFSNTDSLVVANGSLTTDTAAYATGNVTAITGQVFGAAITGLVSNPNQPTASVSPDGLFIYDNTLTFPQPYVTNPGLLLNVATNPVTEYNIFSDSPAQYELYSAVGGGYTGDIFGTFSVTAVPEPAVWALLLLGFGGIGWSLRGNRRSGLAAAV